MLNFFQEYSYIGLFLILTLEEGGIPLPIPGDFFIASVSALPQANYFLTVLTVVASTMVGSTILFSISKNFGHKLLLKYGPKIKITKDKVDRVEGWFQKHGGRAIIIGRLIPGLRIITPIVAGTFEVKYTTFWFYTAIAAFLWANIYYFLGKVFTDLLTLFK